MADYEVSKLMWAGIVVSLATSIFVIAKPQVTKQTTGALDTVSKVVKMSNSGTETSAERPNYNDSKWKQWGFYGENGIIVSDTALTDSNSDKGNYLVYAIDPSKPIVVTNDNTGESDNMMSLVMASEQSYTDENGTHPNLAKDPKYSQMLYDTPLQTGGGSITYNDPVKASGNMQHFFGAAGQTPGKLIGLDKWDTSQVTNMSQMFALGSGFDDTNPQYLGLTDIQNWDTSNVTDMSDMFGAGVSGSLDLSKWNMSKVKNISNMFGESNLTSINLSNLNLSSISNVDRLLPTTLKTLDLSNINLTNVSDFSNIMSTPKNNQTDPNTGLVLPGSISMTITAKNIILSKDVDTSQPFNTGDTTLDKNLTELFYTK